MNFLYIVVAVGVVFGLCVAFKTKLEQYVFVLFFVCLMIYISIPNMKANDLFRVSGNELLDIQGDGTFIISSGTSWVDETELIMGETVSVDEVNSFLSNCTKSVNAYIKRGTDYLWSYNFGLPENISGDNILDIYNTYISDNKVPNPHTRYEFWCFYINS